MSDPFDSLDDEDREGDPFADLEDVAGSEPASDGDKTEEEASSQADSDGEGTGSADAEPDPFEYLGEGTPGVPDARGPAEGERDSGDAEFVSGGQVDVASDRFGEVDVSRGDPFESADSPFQEVDVTEVNPDAVWERFTEESSAEPTVEPLEDEVVVVSKHEFCEGCPHFTPPPDIECTHRGTSILEFLDPDEVRVENCPIVGERRDLGESY